LATNQTLESLEIQTKKPWQPNWEVAEVLNKIKGKVKGAPCKFGQGRWLRHVQDNDDKMEMDLGICHGIRLLHTHEEWPCLQK
jgi:hypothetical protein